MIPAITGRSQCSIHEIIHSHLKLKKVTSRWVPHELSEKNRQDRVNICKENLAFYKSGPGRLCDILRGDETWIYLRQIARKFSNASWVGEGQSPNTVVKRENFEQKCFLYYFKPAAQY